MQAQDLVRPLVFSVALGQGRDGANIDILCHKNAVLDAELHVRHRPMLILPNLSWPVADQPMAEPLLGRPILEVLGLNNKKILAAAADRLHGGIDMRTALQEAAERGTISRVHRNGDFHSDNELDCPSAEFENDWLDLGIDEPTEKRAAIET